MILEPGKNCWRIERAERLAWLVDGAAYYPAFHNVVSRAEASILILGWDIDSRLCLVRGDQRSDLPLRLGPFLNHVVSHRSGLRAHVLTWDFAMIYALEREWLPLYKLEWRTHERLNFRMDDRHPVGASCHQKIVVVDDAVAFVGGFDLSKWRWDSSEHLADDPRRTDPDGERYPPFHDVQFMVAGDIAAVVGELARTRIGRATGKTPEPPPERDYRELWPDTIRPDMTGVDVAIARTDPAYEGHSEVREVEALHIDAIRAARKAVYIENQYFTSHRIGEVIRERLQQQDGPEFVIVLPLQTGGWLEQNTMDVLRCRLLRRLRAADRFDRLRVYYPDNPEPGAVPLSVHSKILVADDRLLRVGSANFSNRSMGLDIECDLAVEGTRPEIADSIARFRNGLLAEHLDTKADAVAAGVDNEGSLQRAVEKLRHSGRSLQPLEPSVDPMVEELLPESALLDPEKPVEPEGLAETILGPYGRLSAGRLLLLRAGLLATVCLAAALWRWSGMVEWPKTAALVDAAPWLEDWMAVTVLGGFVLGGVAFVPVNLLLAATLLLFEPVSGFLYAFFGSQASAAVTFWLGRAVGRDRVRKFAGKRLNRVSRCLAKQGLVSLVAVRILPVASFTVVNLIAGASRIRFGQYQAGTFLGMLPGLIGLALVVTLIKEALREPSWIAWGVLAGFAALILLVALPVQSRLQPAEAAVRSRGTD